MFLDIVYCIMTTGLSFGVTFAAAMLMCCLTRPRRKYFCVSFSVGLAIYLAVVVIVNFKYYANVVDLPKGLLAVSLWIDKYMKMPMLIFIMLYAIGLFELCFSITLKEMVFFASASYLIQHSPVSLYAAIMSLTQTANYWIFALTYLLFYAVYYFLFVKKIRNDEIEIKNTTLIVTAITAAVLIFTFEYISQLNSAFVGNLYQLATCLIMLFLLFGYFQQSRTLNEKEKLESLLSAEQKHYENMRYTLEAIDRKSHDLKYLVAALKKTDDENQRNIMLDNLTAEAERYGCANRTNNKALNAILAEKNAVCDSLGVKLYCIIDGSLLEFMEIGDLYSLFGNALDNAVEHTSAIKDEGRRTINVCVKKKENFVSLHIENTLDGKPQVRKDNTVFTTKEDKRLHGYGLKSINYVTKKYGGELSITADDGVFSLDIIFSA